MLDGRVRGEQAGCELARRLFPFGVPRWALPIAAQIVLAQWKRAGFAHLYPEELFLKQFPAAFVGEHARRRALARVNRQRRGTLGNREAQNASPCDEPFL